MPEISQTMVLILDPPIKWAEGKEFSQITLAEPTVDEWDRASRIEAPIASNVHLVSLVATRMSGEAVSETVVRKMRRGDLLRAIGFFDECTAKSLEPPGPDGENQSPISSGIGAA